VKKKLEFDETKIVFELTYSLHMTKVDFYIHCHSRVHDVYVKRYFPRPSLGGGRVISADVICGKN
jgi:hypothetical protein